MQLKKALRHAAIAAAFVGSVASAPAVAAPGWFFFDQTGTGTFDATKPISIMDWLPDNALAVGAVPLSPVPQTFDLFAQAMLGLFTPALGGNPVSFTGGLIAPTAEITFQATLNESGNIVDLSGTQAQFSSVGGSFTIWFDPSADANMTTGDGYGGGGGAVAILTGTILPEPNNGNFSITVNPTTGLPVVTGLDPIGGGSNPAKSTVGTVVGTGSATLTATVDSFDPNYLQFEGVNPLIFTIDLLFASNLVTPFNQAIASNQVVGQVPFYGAGVPGFAGGVNGLGVGCAEPNCDFHFQQDGSSSFRVPEPATLALLGLALIGIGVVRRRRIAA